MKVIEILQSLVGKTGFVFTKLSQKLRCLNEQQQEVRNADSHSRVTIRQPYVSLGYCAYPAQFIFLSVPLPQKRLGRCATFNFHSFIHSHPNTVYFSLHSAALLSTFILSFILIPKLFIFLFIPLRYFQLSFFHSFSSQHCLFFSSFRCATFNFHSFIHSHPNTVYFSLYSAALLSTFILSFILIPKLFIFLFIPLRYFQLSFFHSFSSQHCLFFSSFRCATFNFHSFIHSHPVRVWIEAFENFLRRQPWPAQIQIQAQIQILYQIQRQIQIQIQIQILSLGDAFHFFLRF